ncbi:MAG: asparagine synthase C-terminal domain-containing protein [Methanoregulaceae archaeon]|nr:asparagine synthase C-terminal domain-containing protein [Methanoregulaceae archaeon]
MSISLPGRYHLEGSAMYREMEFSLSGWIEIGGRRLSPEEVFAIVKREPHIVRNFGGEFLVEWDGCIARDCYGVMPGPCPPGTVRCSDGTEAPIVPSPDPAGLDEAIVRSVELRCSEGVCALSGGIDSALIARIADLPCISVGFEGSHDLAQARYAADLMGIACDYVVITEGMVETALREVVKVLQEPNALHASIAVGQFWISSRAKELGYRRILSGQGADELFGGYARYLASSDLPGDLEAGLTCLSKQIERDQSVAAFHGAYFSLPYLDTRVVRAASEIPAFEKVTGGVRKRPLRLVAERYIPAEIAWKEKKAMQYGTGIWKAMRAIARHNGYKRSVQPYIDQLAER